MLESAKARVRELSDERDRLAAIIAKHDLCHDLHGKVGREEFEEGCRRETVKEFGSCGWAERIAELEAHVRELEQYARDSTAANSQTGAIAAGGGKRSGTGCNMVLLVLWESHYPNEHRLGYWYPSYGLFMLSHVWSRSDGRYYVQPRQV